MSMAAQCDNRSTEHHRGRGSWGAFSPAHENPESPEFSPTHSLQRHSELELCERHARNGCGTLLGGFGPHQFPQAVHNSDEN